MTEPKDNEEINEELSTDELKSVSGGITYREDGANRFSNVVDAKGSGSGMTKDDYRKSMRKKLQLGSEGELW